MAAAPIASASSKNASLHPSPLRRKPLSPRTPRIHISAIQAACNSSVVVDQSTHSKDTRSFMARTANLSVRCRPIKIQIILKVIQSPVQVSHTKDQAHCMMIEVAQPLIHKISESQACPLFFH
jgi:hypothetical protein